MRYITLAFTEHGTACPVMASLLYNHTFQSFFILHFPHLDNFPTGNLLPSLGNMIAHQHIPSLQLKTAEKNTSCQFFKATSPAITWYWCDQNPQHEMNPLHQHRCGKLFGLNQQACHDSCNHFQLVFPSGQQSRYVPTIDTYLVHPFTILINNPSIFSSRETT